MSSVQELARELARALRDSPQNRAFQQALAHLQQDPDAENLIRDFRVKQLELQAMKVAGQQIPAEHNDALQSLYDKVANHAAVQAYLDAEQRLAALLSEVQQSISEAVVPGA